MRSLCCLLLLVSVARAGAPVLVPVGEPGWTAARVAPDRKLAVVALPRGVALVELPSRKQRWTHALPPAATRAMAFSRDGALVATLVVTGDDDRLLLLRVADGSVVEERALPRLEKPVEPGGGSPQKAFYRDVFPAPRGGADAFWLANEIGTWAVKPGAAAYKVADAPVFRVVGQEGASLWGAVDDGFFEVARGAAAAVHLAGCKLASLAVDAKLGRAAVVCGTLDGLKQLRLVDLGGKALGAWSVPGLEVGVALLDGEHALVVTALPGLVGVVGGKEGVRWDALGADGWAQLAVSPSGRRGAAAGHGNLLVRELAPGGERTLCDTRTLLPLAPDAVGFDGDDKLWVVARDGGSPFGGGSLVLVRLALPSCKVEERRAVAQVTLAQGSEARWLPRPRAFAVMARAANGESQLVLLPATAGAPLVRLALPPAAQGEPLVRFAASPDGARLILNGYTRAALVVDGKVAALLEGVQDRALPCGERVLALHGVPEHPDDESSMRVLDWAVLDARGKVLRELALRGMRDGRQVVTTGAAVACTASLMAMLLEGELTVSDVATGALRLRLRLGDTTGVRAIFLSPDGRFVDLAAGPTWWQRIALP